MLNISVFDEAAWVSNRATILPAMIDREWNRRSLRSIVVVNEVFIFPIRTATRQSTVKVALTSGNPMLNFKGQTVLESREST